jgi:hypothetical protein
MDLIFFYCLDIYSLLCLTFGSVPSSQTSYSMKMVIFCNIVPCSLYMKRHFGGAYHLHLQCRKSLARSRSQARESSEPMGTGQRPFLLPSGPYIIINPTDSSFCLTPCSRWFLARLIFDHEDGGDTFLRNVGSYTDYTALYPSRWQFSFS